MTNSAFSRLLRRSMLGLVSASLLLPAVASAQTPPAAPARGGAAPATAAQRDAGYTIGPDDTIEVDVLGQADFKTRARVREDGTIQLPLLGSVKVSGRTPVTLAEELAAKLKSGGFFAKPIVNVEIASFSSRYVIVLGEVGSPGLLPVDRAYRVSEVIARSGGIRESGADYVVLRPVTGDEKRLPFEKLATGSTADDPFVTAGDKVYVPAAPLYYVYGQVNAPGAYPLKGELTLRKALARGGGMTQAGSEKRVKLFHGGESQKVNMEYKLQAGDVVVVGERVF